MQRPSGSLRPWGIGGGRCEQERRARHPHKTGTALDFEGEIEFLKELEREQKAKGGGK